MTSTPPRREVTLAAAAAATLAAGSCRLRVTYFSDPPGEHDPTLVDEGVADLVRWRLDTTWRSTDGGGAAFTAALLERYPWLDDGEDADGYEPSEYRVVLADGIQYDEAAGEWLRTEDRRPRGHALWIVRQLVGVPGTAGRFRLALDPDPAVHGEAWADAVGRLARVTWSPNPRERPRGPFRFGTTRSWQTLELSDYGLAVDIAIPDARPPDSFRVLARDAWRGARAIRRRKRAWEAEHQR